jgi:hypothetical protein
MERASHATRRVRTRVPKFRFMNEVGGPYPIANIRDAYRPPMTAAGTSGTVADSTSRHPPVKQTHELHGSLQSIINMPGHLVWTRTEVYRFVLGKEGRRAILAIALPRRYSSRST